MLSRGKQVIQEADYGIYVWEMPDGRWVGDDAGNYAASTLCSKGSVEAKKALGNLVREFSKEAYELGTPKFLAGRRPVTDEEYAEQNARMQLGLTPDPYDIPAAKEDLRNGTR